MKGQTLHEIIYDSNLDFKVMQGFINKVEYLSQGCNRKPHLCETIDMPLSAVSPFTNHLCIRHLSFKGGEVTIKISVASKFQVVVWPGSRYGITKWWDVVNFEAI